MIKSFLGIEKSVGADLD